MGFFSNPAKAFKGFCKDPIGRVIKDLGLRDGDCTPKGHVEACGHGANVGGLAGATAGVVVGGGVPGAVRGAATGAAAGCVKGVADYRAVCTATPYTPK